MIGFDCPFQLASCSEGMGRMPDFLTCKPGFLGRASVAFNKHCLLASVAVQAGEAAISMRAAQTNTFMASPSV